MAHRAFRTLLAAPVVALGALALAACTPPSEIDTTTGTDGYTTPRYTSPAEADSGEKAEKGEKKGGKEAPAGESVKARVEAANGAGSFTIAVADGAIVKGDSSVTGVADGTYSVSAVRECGQGEAVTDGGALGKITVAGGKVADVVAPVLSGDIANIQVTNAEGALVGCAAAK